MPRLIAKPWFLALLTAWLLSGAGIAETEPVVDQGARLPVFEIQRDGRQVGYLVGTMHTDDPRVMALLDSVVSLLKRSDILAIEMIPDGVAMLAVGAATLLPADKRLSEMLGTERYEAVLATARSRGLPETVLDRLKPWAVAITLGVPELSGQQVLDTAIYLSASERGLKTVGLESAIEQIRVFDDMPPDLELQLLDAMIKNSEELPKQVEALTGAFLSGDLARIDAVARSQYGEASPELRQWFEAALLDHRNTRMLQRALPLFDEGRALIAVGAMHLGGPSGLIVGLREAGFAVVAVEGLGPGRSGNQP